MNCKNCEEILQGKYCHQCGQRADVGRITLKSLVSDFSNGVLQLNRGFFYTLIALFRNPGKSIAEYLSGKRKKYFKPLTYVLTLSTIYFLISQFTGQNTWLNEFLSGALSEAYDLDEGGEIPSALTWFSKNYAYATILLLPVFSLASRISFTGLGRTYLEHIVTNSFITGQQAIFYLIFAVVTSFHETYYTDYIPVLLSLTYTFWVYWKLFKAGNRILNILRSIVTYGLYILFSILLFLLVRSIIEFIANQ